MRINVTGRSMPGSISGSYVDDPNPLVQNLITECQGDFEIVVEFDGTSFTSSSTSLYDILIDLLVNYELLKSGVSFSFFIQEEPLFVASKEHHDLVAQDFKGEGPYLVRTELRESYQDAIDYLQAYSEGLMLGIIKGSQELREHFKSAVERDLASDNRKLFLKG